MNNLNDKLRYAGQVIAREYVAVLERGNFPMTLAAWFQEKSTLNRIVEIIPSYRLSNRLVKIENYAREHIRFLLNKRPDLDERLKQFQLQKAKQEEQEMINEIASWKSLKI